MRRLPHVFVLTPFTHDLHPDIMRAHLATVAAQDYPAYRHVMLPNAYPPHVQRFGNHARARNDMLEAVNHPGPVLWVDADIVDLPPNLIGRLIDRMWGDASVHIIAPVVRIQEARETGRVFNGWFYDTSAFIDADGNHLSHDWQWPGVNLIPMQSVGCVYMVDTTLRPHMYRPISDEVEHISYCRAVGGVYLDPTLTAYHANLPAYGQTWH